MSEECGRGSKTPWPEASAQAVDAIRERFAAWLDETLDDESPPPGVAEAVWDALDEERPAGQGAPVSSSPAGAPDLYQLFSAFTALTQEVKLQGRAFGRLAGTSTQEQDNALRREGEDQVWREMLDALLEVRDSLLRGHQACALHLTDPSRTGAGEGTPAPGAAARLAGALASILRRVDPPATSPWGRLLTMLPAGGAQASSEDEPRARPRFEAVSALEEGLELSLRRLDELLASRGVRSIECLGHPFDPHRMVAVGLEDTETGPDGLVLEVYREGYERDDEVLQPSRVKVARRRASAPGEGQ